MGDIPICAVAVRNMTMMPVKKILDGPELVLFFFRIMKKVWKNKLAYIPVHPKISIHSSDG